MDRKDIDMRAVRPYADQADDGLMQLSFTLPVPCTPSARAAALALVRQMGVERPDLVHCQPLLRGFTYFVVYGRCRHSVDYAAAGDEGADAGYLTEAEIDAYAQRHIGRPVVVVGASTGSDTHSVGIDAMLNAKGFHGHCGLESYRCFVAYNLGSQVPNHALLAKAVEVGADAILVSQTVTQQGLHIGNLTELVEMAEAEGLRDDVVLVCGGARVTGELAKELGFDAGFSKGTYPYQLATFLVRELGARLAAAARAPAPAGAVRG
jgi:beta-lysine 5,6-aminomutase beta subunit